MTPVASRTASFARNAAISVLTQGLTILLGFLTRTVFVACLGVELLGVNSLLTSTLAMLTLADLGVNAALMYELYEPLKRGDVRTATALVTYARRLFRWIAFVVGSLGLAATPFIHHFVRLERPVPHLELYYLTLLVNVVVNYLMLNRQILVEADQRVYIIKRYSLIFNALRSLLQIASLVILGSFLAYLLLQVVTTIANNLVVYIRVGRMYPWLRRASAVLPRRSRRSLHQSVRALLVFRAGGLALQNSGPLLISVIIGTQALGFYSNYMLIVGSIVIITETAFAALTPSVGNYVADGGEEASDLLFDELVLLSIMTHGSIAVALVAFSDDLVSSWLGPGFVLPPAVGWAIAFNFYVTGTLMPIWSFRSATGLFRRTQWLIVGTTVISVVLSFVMGYRYGLVGVVLAPALARLVTGGWYEPWLLMRDYTKGTPYRFFGLQLGSFLIWVMLASGAVAIGSWFPTGTLPTFLCKVALVFVVMPGVMFLSLGRLDAARRLQARAKRVFGHALCLVRR